jgi:hypothetical protein
MARTRSTSRKRSAASSSRRKPPEPLVFFIDRSLGRKKVPEALRAAGVEIRVHVIDRATLLARSLRRLHVTRIAVGVTPACPLNVHWSTSNMRMRGRSRSRSHAAASCSARKRS